LQPSQTYECDATLTIRRPGEVDVETLHCDAPDGHDSPHSFAAGALKATLQIVSFRSTEGPAARSYSLGWYEV
jgi:hypothetical protein